MKVRCSLNVACCALMLGIGSSLLVADSAPTSQPTAASQPMSASRPTSDEPRPDQSPIVAADSRIEHDVPYRPGAGAMQKLDIYTPAKAKGAPVVLFVHGGEWTKGDKREVSYKPRFLNEQGIVFVSMNYRLSGTAKHPAQVEDIAYALRWLRDHVADYGGDANKLVLMGHSAGCHMVTLVGLDDRIMARVGMRPSQLAAIVSWSGGAFDLVAKVAEAGMYADYIRLNFGPAAQVWRDASPMTYVDRAARAPRFLIVSAEHDKPASRQAAAKLASEIKTHGGRAEYLIFPGKTHRTANHEVGMPGDGTGPQLVAFIRQAVKR